jgi:hypothetical protein
VNAPEQSHGVFDGEKSVQKAVDDLARIGGILYSAVLVSFVFAGSREREGKQLD